ncbi:S-adenosyl-L-methionine-dependent methyltransferase [Xylariales sp. PMI_506]|nr:S-adenosyl-L-methionine-dependent methyltransferase [Xylariales sp. PMI_506]
MEDVNKFYEEIAGTASDKETSAVINSAESTLGAPAAALLVQAGLRAQTQQPFRLLDNACGPGTITAQLQRSIDRSVLESSKMTCADNNTTFVGIAQKRARSLDWINTETMVLDAQDTKLPDRSFTHVVVSFALHVIPDPDAVLRDTLRILQAGGTFACSTMHKDSLGWYPDLRSALQEVCPETTLPDRIPMVMNRRLEWTDERAAQVLEAHGFEQVRFEKMHNVQHLESADAFMETFGVMVKHLTESYWTSEQRQKHQDSLRERVIRHLQQKHGGAGWDINWTLILITSRKPSTH